MSEKKENVYFLLLKKHFIQIQNKILNYKYPQNVKKPPGFNRLLQRQASFRLFFMLINKKWLSICLKFHGPHWLMKTFTSTYKNEFSDTQAENFCSLFWV